MNISLLFSVLFFFVISCSNKSVRNESSGAKKPNADLSARPNVPAQNSGEALYSAAIKYYQQKDYQKSYDYSVTSLTKLSSSPKEIEAHILALRSAMRIGKLSEAVAITDLLLKKSDISQGFSQETLQTRLKAQEQLGDYLSSLSTMEKMKALPYFNNEVDSFKIKAEEIIQNKLSFQDLSKIQDDSQFLSLRETHLLTW